MVRAFVPLFLAVCAVVSAANGYADTLTAAEQAVLARGEPVVRFVRDPGSATSWASGRAFAAIDIPAPPEAVFRTLSDCRRLLRVASNLISCRALRRDPKGAWEDRETVVSVSQFLPNFRAVARVDYFPYRTIRFKQTEGNFDFLEGQWDLSPFRSGRATRAFYRVRAGTSVPVPEMVIQSLIETEVPATLKALRDEVLRGPAS
jgi:ribosome-associated toxin RatA of RatAB toxin-antitoxin module